MSTPPLNPRLGSSHHDDLWLVCICREWCFFNHLPPLCTALLHSFLIALASKRQIWQTKAAMQGVMVAVRLAQERLSAAAPAGAQVEIKQHRRREPARTWKLEGVFWVRPSTERRNFTISTSRCYRKANLAVRGALGHCGKRVTSSAL